MSNIVARAGIAAHILYSILGPAWTDYLLSTMGVNIREFLTNSRLAKQLTDTKIKHIIGEVMKVLRNGLRA